jgi:hypothetical protein
MSIWLLRIFIGRLFVYLGGFFNDIFPCRLVSLIINSLAKWLFAWFVSSSGERLDDSFVFFTSTSVFHSAAWFYEGVSSYKNKLQFVYGANCHLLVETEENQNRLVWTKFKIFSPGIKLRFFVKPRLACFKTSVAKPLEHRSSKYRNNIAFDNSTRTLYWSMVNFYSCNHIMDNSLYLFGYSTCFKNSLKETPENISKIEMKDFDILRHFVWRMFL